MSAERPPIPPIYTTSKEIGVIAKEIDWIFVEGLLIFLGRKVRAEGIPKAIQFCTG